jgi:hypothetical protein
MYEMKLVLEVLLTLVVGAIPVLAQTTRSSGNDTQVPHEEAGCE